VGSANSNVRFDADMPDGPADGSQSPFATRAGMNYAPTVRRAALSSRATVSI
jgi:hypothetical protein